MADCQDLVNAVSGITAQMVINNTTIDTKLSDIYAILSTINTTANGTNANLANIEVDLFNMELVHTSILLDLDDILKTFRDPTNSLITLWAELHTLNDAFKGSDSVWDRLKAISDDIITVEAALYDDTRTDSIGESTSEIFGALSKMQDDTDNIASNTGNINSSIIAGNILLGSIFTAISSVTTAVATVTTAVAGVTGAIGVVSGLLGTISTTLLTLNSEILPISNFFTTLKNIDEIILAIERIDSLLTEVKESIEAISIEIFQSKQGQVIQVKG